MRRTFILAVVAALTASRLPAPDCSTCGSSFGMIGVALGQTLRVNVVAVLGSPCSAMLGFVDRNGLPIGPPNKSVNLAAGQAAFLDLNANTLLAAFGQRAEVRPVAAPQPGPVPSLCSATAEVFDNFLGLSQVMVPNGPPQIPSGPPNFGMMGLTRGQAVRLSVVSVQIPSGPPQGPCIAELGFLGSNGLPIGPPNKTVTLNAGESASLDLAGAGLVSGFGARAEVQPFVNVTSAPGALSCSSYQTAAEAFDTLTGRTWTRLIPVGPPN